MSTLAGLPVVNSLFLILEKAVPKDWHIIVGHLSNIYIKKFIEICDIKKPGKTISSGMCEVCRMAKWKRSSHSNPLTTAKSLFMMIHMDVLQVTPIFCGIFK